MTLTTTQQPSSKLFVAKKSDHQAVATYLASLQPTGARAAKQSLARVATVLGVTLEQIAWSALTPDVWQGVVGLLSHYVVDPTDPTKRYAPATINHCIAAVRGVLKQAYLAGRINHEVYTKLLMVKDVKGSRLPAGRDLVASDIQALLQTCDTQTPGGIRDRAIIATLLTSGLRLHELVSIDLGDYDPVAGRVVVIGKGNKQRGVYLGAAVSAITAWVSARGDHEGPLFCPVNKGGVITIKRLTTQAVYNMLSTRGQTAEVPRFSPHDFRRTCIGLMLSNQTDIATIAKHVGHASVTTTARYDRRGDSHMQAAVARVQVPGLST